MYSLIAQNKTRTVVLFVLIASVIGLLSWGVSYFSGNYYTGFALLSIISIITTIVFFNSTGSVLRAIKGIQADPSVEQHKDLMHIVENLSITAGIPVPTVYIIPDSGLNACAAGLTPDKAILGVTQGLLDTMDKEELEGVIGHEISHIKNYDTRVSVMAYAIAVSLLVLGEVLIRMRGGKNNPLPLVGLAILLIGYPAVLLTRLALSRQREYLADVSSIELTRNPEGLASALEKLKSGGPANMPSSVSHMFFNNFNQGFFSNLMSTHPPLEKRIARVRDSFTHM
jgi:heat shock protein HtpX